MPQMPGTQVLRELRRLCPNVCVAIISGYTEQEVAAHFEQEAPAGYLQKPFTSQTVQASVTKLLQGMNRERKASLNARESHA
jgi:DNA-binding NtrC family response regulator